MGAPRPPSRPAFWRRSLAAALCACLIVETLPASAWSAGQKAAEADIPALGPSVVPSAAFGAAALSQLGAAGSPEALIGSAAGIVDSPTASADERAAAAAILAAAAQPDAYGSKLEDGLRSADARAAAEAGAALRALRSPEAHRLAVAAVLARRDGFAGLTRLFEGRPSGSAADVPASAPSVASATSGRLQPASLRRVAAFYQAKPAEPPAPVGPAIESPAEAPAPGAAPGAAPRPDEEKPLEVDAGHWYSFELLMPRLLAFGHFNAFNRHLVRIIKRLAIPGDNPNYSVRLKFNPDPNAAIVPAEAFMLVHLGLLSVTATEDQLASVVAHEMTHANKEQLKALNDDPEVARFLDSLDGYQDLGQSQREEIRADLGALERLIKAGYNPWAQYEFERSMAKLMKRAQGSRLLGWLMRRLFPKSMEYMSTHPASEVRMSAVKAYILRRGFKEDLSGVVQARTPLPWSLRLLRWRMWPITMVVMTPFLYYYLILKLGYSAVLTVAGWISPAAREIVITTKDSVSSAAGTAGTAVGDFFSAYVAHPLGVLAGPAWHAIASHMPASLGYDVLLTATLLGVSGWLATLITLVGRAYYNEPQYALLKRVRDDYRSVSARLGEADLAALAATGADRLDDIQSIYFTPKGLVRAFRWFDGLSVAYYRWPRLLRRLLDEQRRLASMTPEQRQAAARAWKPVLWGRDLAPYAAENARLRASFKALAKDLGIELPADHPAVLVDEALRLRAAGDGAGILRLVPGLVSTGLYDTLAEVLTRRRWKVFAAALGPKAAGDEKLAQNWIDGQNAMRSFRTTRRTKYRERLWQESMLTLSRLTRLFSPLEDRLAAAALTENVPLLNWGWLSVRGGLDALDRLALRWRVGRSFGSMSELSGALAERWRPRAIPDDTIRPLFNRAVAAHPEWLRTKADLDAMIASPELWPQFGERSGSELEAMLIEAIKKRAQSLPGPWSYEPASSQRLHSLYVERLTALGLEPKTLAERVELWRLLTSRGVTTATDAMFETLLAEAEGPARAALEDDAMQGRIWDPRARAAIVRRRFREAPVYRALLAATDARRRATLLARSVEWLTKAMPDRGIAYAELIEDLSRDIHSTPQESAFLQRQKLPVDSGEKSEDFSLRLLSGVLTEALTWRRSQQWKLILFLRGDAPPSRKMRRAFRTVGPERVKRFFDVLPLSARVGLIDSFLDSPKGLASKIDPRGGWAGTIIDHVLPGEDKEARRVAREMLEAFLYSLKKSGNPGFQSYVLAYMLALPKNETSSVGKTLRGVLEIFGATGVKIGQFLAASQLLPEEQTRELRKLQEKALIPEREEVYRDLREIGGRADMPFRLRNLLGAASIKYAMLAQENESGDPLVLKIFRQSAIAHTNQEFIQLDYMAQFLEHRHGPRYGALRAIVAAAKKAVARELKAENELERSQIAQRKIYAGRDRDGVLVSAPAEVLANARLIAAEFADGVSLFDLPDAASRAWAAREVMRLEKEILFADADVIDFDPDRHPGNYRLSVKDGKLFIKAIDQGQGLTITRQDRDRIVSLFALSQIAREAGGARWVVDETARVMGLDETVKKRLGRALGRYFPDRGLARPAAYFTMLAALSDAGADVDASYFDFVRGIVQFTQYEELAGPQAESPSAALEAAVRAKAEEYRKTLSVSTMEKLAIGWDRLKESAAAWPGIAQLRDFLYEPGLMRQARRAAVAAVLLGAASFNQAVVLEAAQTGWTYAVETARPYYDPVAKLRARLDGRPAAEQVHMLMDEMDKNFTDALPARLILAEKTASGEIAPDLRWFGDLVAGLTTRDARGPRALLALADAMDARGRPDLARYALISALNNAPEAEADEAAFRFEQLARQDRIAARSAAAALREIAHRRVDIVLARAARELEEYDAARRRELPARLTALDERLRREPTVAAAEAAMSFWAAETVAGRLPEGELADLLSGQLLKVPPEAQVALLAGLPRPIELSTSDRRSLESVLRLASLTAAAPQTRAAALRAYAAGADPDELRALCRDVLDEEQDPSVIRAARDALPRSSLEF